MPRSRRWVVAGVTFAVAAVAPSLFFLVVGLQDDPTASASAGSLVLMLIGIEIVIGGLLALFGWAASDARTPRARGVMTAVVVGLAIGSGLVTGFLGGVAIAMERHPTWDDA